MKIKVSLFNCTTNDLAVVIDLLRASTTITVALNHFNRVIPVNNQHRAMEIKNKQDDAILAGEENLHNIEGFDITNSPYLVQKYDDKNILVLKTTNGTRVLENIKNHDENIKVLVGSAVNAESVAEKAIELADNEIELIMAGRHGEFNIEDAVGAGFIVEEIIKTAEDKNMKIELEESALACLLLAEDHEKAVDLIENSWGSKRLTKQGLYRDVEICCRLNDSDNVAIYEDGELRKL